MLPSTTDTSVSHSHFFWNEEHDNMDADDLDIWNSFNLLPTPPMSPEYISKSYDSASDGLNPNLIQDCMWPTDQKSRNISIQKTSLSNQKQTNELKEPLPIFPYPLNDPIHNKYPIFTQLNKEDGADTPSDSDDDEIDVVTVEKPYLLSCSLKKQILPAATSRSAQVAEMHSYSSPVTIASQRANAPLLSNHAYSLSMRSNGNNTILAKTLKRTRFHSKRNRSKHSALRNALRNNTSRFNCDDSAGESSGSRVSSDCEDDGNNGVGKRGQHNLLERRRRDDLKSSFHRLRDIIPDVKRLERTPKVTILRKASDHIKNARNQHRQMSIILEQHKVIQNRLRNKLLLLNRGNRHYKPKFF